MLDYQTFVDSVNMPCRVLSVAKNRDGGCGEIRISAADPAWDKKEGAAAKRKSSVIPNQ